MTSWRDQYSPIEACVIVSEGANTLTTDKYAQKSIPCGCEPSYAGELICRDHRCINFSTQTECVKCKAGCCNKKIQEKQNAKLSVIETPGKGHGLFAAENLKKKQFLMEYVGEIIDEKEFSRRSADRGRIVEHQYIMQLKSNVLLDAGRKGSISRFINHSCEPNCCVEVWTVQGNLRVAIFTLCDIKDGTELTFDYKWTKSERAPTRCNCGTEYCRGFLEILTDADKAELKLQKGVWRRGGSPISQMQPSKSSSDLATATKETLLAAPINVPIAPSEGPNMASFDDGAPLPASESYTTDNAEQNTRSTTNSPVSPVLAQQSAPSPPLNDIYNAQGLLVPELFIGRRVKVWWAGNLAYLEADVEGFNPKTKHYLCRYLVDDSVSEEDFGPSVGSSIGSGTSSNTTSGATPASSTSGLQGVQVKWFWRDSSVEETVIKKKASTEVLGDDDASQHSHSDHSAPPSRTHTSHTSNSSAHSSTTPYNTSGSSNNGNFNPFAQNTSARAAETVSARVARVITEMYAVGSEQDDAGCAFVSAPHNTDLQNVVQIFQQNFGVKVTLLSDDANTSNNTTNNSNTSNKKVVMYGEHAAIASVTALLRQAEKQALLSNHTQLQAHTKALRNRQGTVCTNDWRFKNTLSNTNDANKANLSHFEAYFAHKLLTIPDLSCLSVLNHILLPTGVHANTGVEITENIRKVLILNMQGLCVRLGFDIHATTQANLLLVRYLRYVSNTIVKESTAVLAAIALIVAKHSSEFKYKVVASVVRSAYCQVFRRDEEDVMLSSVEPYIESALDKERAIYSKLQSDVFSADVVPFFVSRVRHNIWADKWRFEYDELIQGTTTASAKVSGSGSCADVSAPKDKLKDREADRQKRKKLATFQYETNIRYGVRRSVLHVGEGLAQELLNIYTASGGSDNSGGMVLSVLPVELVQLSCIVLTALLHTMLPSVNVHKRIVNEVDSYVAEVVAVALGPLHYTAALLRWSTEVFAEACLDQFPHLSALFECFKELRDAKFDLVRTFRHSVNGCLLKIIDAVTGGRGASSNGGSGGSGGAYGTSNGNSSNGSDAYPHTFASPTNPSRPFQDSDEPCKHRFPWLSSGEVEGSGGKSGSAGNVCLHSSLTVEAFRGGKYCPAPDREVGVNGQSSSSDGDLLVPYGKDTFFGFASGHTDSSKFLSRVTLYSNSRNSASASSGFDGGSAGLVAVRAFPSQKTLLKEAKRAGYDDVTALGPLPATLSELHCLQHLHYFYTTASSDGDNFSGECPFFVAPVGVLTVPATTLNENHTLRTTLTTEVSLKRHDNAALAATLARDALPVKYDLNFLAFPAVHLSLATVLGFNTQSSSPRWDLISSSLQAERAITVLENNKGHLLAPAFAVELCRDLYRAVAHMTSCGVYLKWLVLEHLYLTSGGRLQIGGLTGAVMGGSTVTSSGEDSEEPLSVTQLSAQLTRQKAGHNTSTSTGTGSATKKKKFSLGATFDDEDEEDNNNNKYDSKCRRAVAKMNIPRTVLYTVAPELLLGGVPSSESSTYCAGAVAAQILFGRPLVKNAAAEDKQLQYIYKTLGTPKPMEYTDFDALPLAQYYGRHIVDEEDNKLRESRSRASKALKELCPGPLLAAYSYGSTGSGEDRHPNLSIGGIRLADAVKISTQAETDSTGVMDLIRVSTSLVPHRRLSAELLLCFRVFRLGYEVHRALSAAPSGHLSRPQFSSTQLQLTSGTNVPNVTLTDLSRFDYMHELVAHLRDIQRVQVPPEVAKKDIYCTPVSAAQVLQLSQMDEILFRKEHAKHHRYGGDGSGDSRDGRNGGGGRDGDRSSYRSGDRNERGGDRGSVAPKPVYNDFINYAPVVTVVNTHNGFSGYAAPAPSYPTYPTTTYPTTTFPVTYPTYVEEGNEYQEQTLPPPAPLAPLAPPAPIAPAVPPPPSVPAPYSLPPPPPPMPQLYAQPQAPTPPPPPAAEESEPEPDYEPFDEDMDAYLNGVDSIVSSSVSKRPVSPTESDTLGDSKKPRVSP